MSGARATPVRSLLVPGSSLHPLVQDGLGAVQAAHKTCMDAAIRGKFADSIELDEAMRAGRERENRWDYLLGYSPSRRVVGLEPHSAKSDQIDKVIRKKRAALDQLAGHLKPGVAILDWLWVASGDVEFADTERARRRLDQHGITFVGKRVEARHLPAPAGAGARKRR